MTKASCLPADFGVNEALAFSEAEFLLEDEEDMLLN